MQFVETVNYASSNNLYTIMQKLNNLPNTFSADFETASKWSDDEKAEIKEYLENNNEILDREEKRILRQYVESTGLSHPSFVYVTHLSVATSPNDSFVAILDNDYKRKRVLNWLANTDRKQIWHNLSFDGKHILYHTGKLPENYEDTEVLSKTLLNHVNTHEAKTGLKHLMGWRYGDWAVAVDYFNIDQIYDEDLIKYAATDSCATYALWEEIQAKIHPELKE